MSTTSQTLPTEQIPALPRLPSVVVGRSDYLSVLLRLTVAELYKLRRRALSKVMASIGIGAIVLVILSLTIYLVTQVNTPATDFAPPLCSHVSQSQNTSCANQQPTQVELAHYKQARIKNIASFLILPNSQNMLNGVIIGDGILILTLIIVTGTIVGGEYSFGTIRLLFTRGPTRIQFLLAKVLAIAACPMIVLPIMTLVGVLLGYALYPISELVPDFQFFTAAWLGHALLILLIQMLGWFTYAMIALLFGTLGRSSVAGIVGGIIWLFIELILTSILPLLAGVIGGSLGKFLGAIPDYFIGNNLSALIQNQYHAMGVKGPTSPLSELHALLVFAGYLVVCIGLSCWLTLKRDVTN